MLSLRTGVAASQAGESSHHDAGRRRSRASHHLGGSPRLSGHHLPGQQRTESFANDVSHALDHQEKGLLDHLSPDFKVKHGPAVEEMLNTKGGGAHLYKAKAAQFGTKYPSLQHASLRSMSSRRVGEPGESCWNIRHPLSTTRIAFDIFISALTLYSILLIPWALGFDISLEEDFPGIYYFVSMRLGSKALFIVLSLLLGLRRISSLTLFS